MWQKNTNKKIEEPGKNNVKDDETEQKRHRIKEKQNNREAE